MVLFIMGRCSTCGMTGPIERPLTCARNSLICQTCPSPGGNESKLGDPQIVPDEDPMKFRMIRMAGMRGFKVVKCELNEKGELDYSTESDVVMTEELTEVGRPCGLCYSVGGRIGIPPRTVNDFGRCPCRGVLQMNFYNRQQWLEGKQAELTERKTKDKEQSKRVLTALRTQEKEGRRKKPKRGQ